MKRRISFLALTFATLFIWDSSLYANLWPSPPAGAPHPMPRAVEPVPGTPANASGRSSIPNFRGVKPRAVPVQIDLVPPAGWQRLPSVKRDLEVRGA
jgi:hypothetical protein